MEPKHGVAAPKGGWPGKVVRVVAVPLGDCGHIREVYEDGTAGMKQGRRGGMKPERRSGGCLLVGVAADRGGLLLGEDGQSTACQGRRRGADRVGGCGTEARRGRGTPARGRRHGTVRHGRRSEHGLDVAAVAGARRGVGRGEPYGALGERKAWSCCSGTVVGAAAMVLRGPGGEARHGDAEARLHAVAVLLARCKHGERRCTMARRRETGRESGGALEGEQWCRRLGPLIVTRLGFQGEPVILAIRVETGTRGAHLSGPGMDVEAVGIGQRAAATLSGREREGRRALGFQAGLWACGGQRLGLRGLPRWRARGGREWVCGLARARAWARRKERVLGRAAVHARGPRAGRVEDWEGECG